MLTRVSNSTSPSFNLCIFTEEDGTTINKPLDREIRIFTFFEHCLIFAIFKPLSVDFGR